MEISEYWQKKLKRVAKISVKMGYSELNEEFWVRIPCAVMSLIEDLNNKLNKASKPKY